jgi:restriction system protein
MTAWLMRAGSGGEREAFALEHNRAGTGFDDVGDLSNATSRELVVKAVAEAYPSIAPRAVANYAAQLNALRNRVSIGDLVVLPLKRSAQIAIGRVTGPYGYNASVATDLRHTVPVEWLAVDVARTAIEQDLLYSLGAFSTICEMRRNDAEYRLEQLAKTGRDPGARPGVQPDTTPADTRDREILDTSATAVDIAAQSADRIRSRVHERFAGHAMEGLVAAVLEANGFVCEVVPEGPDGGIDIYAGKGALGLDAPRLIAQVKSSPTPVEVRVIRELNGGLNSYNADQALLVAWGGLTRAARAEADKAPFTLKVWDSDDLLEALYDTYDLLPEQIRARLPLKQVWTLVEETQA